MDRRFILRIVYKNLRSRKLRTLLTLSGIVIAISAIVFLLSFALGIEKLVTNEVTKGDAFLLLDVGTGNSQLVKLDEKTISEIKDLADVRTVSGIINIGAKAQAKDRTADISFYGTDKQYLSWSGLTLQSGQSLSDNARKTIVINTAYAKLLQLSPQDALGQGIKFDFTIPKELNDLSEEKVVEGQNYVVVGVVQDDSAPKAYTHYQNLIDLGATSYSQLKVEANSKNQIEKVRKQIESTGLKTQYVGDTVSQIEQVFVIFKVVLASFGFVALIVALLGMFNTLTISLLERIKEIALMKMLGMRNKDIKKIFVTEATIFGIAGGLFGLFVGIILSQIANMILNYYATRSGGEPVSVFYYSLKYILIIFAASFLVSFVTGFYPARKATKIDSLEVLRYE
ncbi:MAG: ABC transporter permease [Patescibacteria group bacterium]|nr:ABC transporter permease [Patescibacteria group bacterium]